jgi:arsenate reductase-like glutaredoxin family protein
MIRQGGTEPTVIEYLKTPPSREKLVELIRAASSRKTARSLRPDRCGAKVQ